MLGRSSVGSWCLRHSLAVSWMDHININSLELGLVKWVPERGFIDSVCDRTTLGIGCWGHKCGV